VMMENHAYDNLFGTYCQVVGPHCPSVANGIPPGTCVPYDPHSAAAGCIVPYNFTKSQLQTPDPGHGWVETNTAIDGGRMDGWYAAEGQTLTPFGHYNGTTTPTYWDLAQRYALGDGFFSSALSYSLPNHWYLLAGQVPPRGGVNTTDLTGAGWSGRHAYLNSSNATRTVQDLLNNSPGTSWKYYDWSLPTYQRAINGVPGIFALSAYNYWNPFAARAESYSSWYVSHFVPRSQFFTDASYGDLPAVSWVIPDPSFSDHPMANLSAGESFVASIVNAASSSTEWSSTAIFLSWDDYGGFYDHAPPPRVDPLGLSIRVPLIVISPYTPAGRIVHSQGSFDSLLRFVEWRFNLGCLTPRDCHASLPLDYFDFSMSPRSPEFFPTTASLATYPFATPLAAGPGPPGSGPSYAVTPSAWDTGPPPTDLTAMQAD